MPSLTNHLWRPSPLCSGGIIPSSGRVSNTAHVGRCPILRTTSWAYHASPHSFLGCDGREKIHSDGHLGKFFSRTDDYSPCRIWSSHVQARVFHRCPLIFCDRTFGFHWQNELLQHTTHHNINQRTQADSLAFSL